MSEKKILNEEDLGKVSGGYVDFDIENYPDPRFTYLTNNAQCPNCTIVSINSRFFSDGMIIYSNRYRKYFCYNCGYFGEKLAYGD